jgi:S1-C subfamily serine protease
MDRGGMRKWTISVSTLTAGVIVAASVLGLRSPVASAPGVVRVASAASVTFGASQRGSGFAKSAGTAFSVGPGLLVTNAHVTLTCVANQLPIRVGGSSGTWQVTREDQQLDLVLLRGSEASAIPALALSATAHVQRDTRSLVLGYLANDDAVGPYGALGMVRQATIMVHRPESGQAKSFRAIDRKGNPVDPTWRDGVAFFGETASERMRWALEIGVTMGHGASGGPVVDSGGAVLAVVVADGTGTGLTSAIPLGDLIDFLAAADIVPRFATPGAYGEVNWTRAYRLAAPSVVRVAC